MPTGALEEGRRQSDPMPVADDRHNPRENERLTAVVAVVLLIMLAGEGASLFGIRSHLGLHVFIGTLLVGPVVVKIASTFWRFVHYYLGSPSYKRRGPPLAILRAIGPLVVASTVALIGSGVALMLVGPAERGLFFHLHVASFLVWFCLMTLHVLGHLRETWRLGAQEWLGRIPRRRMARSRMRRWLVLASIAASAPLAAMLSARVGPWLGSLGR